VCSRLITEDSGRFFSRFEEYVTAEHAKYVILTPHNESQEMFIIVLNGVSDFRTSGVTDIAARDDLKFVRLPVYLPD
jgi:hypothetical protein